MLWGCFLQKFVSAYCILVFFDNIFLFRVKHNLEKESIRRVKTRPCFGVNNTKYRVSNTSRLEEKNCLSFDCFFFGKKMLRTKERKNDCRFCLVRNYPTTVNKELLNTCQLRFD